MFGNRKHKYKSQLKLDEVYADKRPDPAYASRNQHHR